MKKMALLSAVMFCVSAAKASELRDLSVNEIKASKIELPQPSAAKNEDGCPWNRPSATVRSASRAWSRPSRCVTWRSGRAEPGRSRGPPLPLPPGRVRVVTDALDLLVKFLHPIINPNFQIEDQCLCRLSIYLGHARLLFF